QMRYAGQSYELPIPVETLDPAQFLPLFHQAHDARYGHSDPARPVEVVTLRVKLTLPAAQHSAGGPAPERKGGRMPPTERDVWFPEADRRPLRTRVFARSSLSRGGESRGPAVITQMDSTTVIPPGWRAVVDGQDNLMMERI